MKNTLYILLILILLLNSCSEPTKENQKPLIAKTKSDSSQADVESKPFANPVFFCGSSTSFGNFLQTLYRLNRFNQMLDFTSKASRIKFGDSALLEFYRHDLKLDFVLGNLTAIEKSNDTINLIYAKASIIARRKVVIPILIENDSCKIIINSLKNTFN